MGGENTDGQRSGKVLDIKDKNINDLGRVHFIGIGGAGMSVLAEILLQKGISVSGSDREKNEIENCLDAVYGVTLLKMKGKPVSEETLQAMQPITHLLEMLSQLYKEKE